MQVKVELAGQDYIEALRQEEGGTWKITASGCRELLNRLAVGLSEEPNPENWVEPAGRGHVDLLLREFILKAKNQWQFPTTDSETCHCRQVPTAVIDLAIINGAHTTRQVSRETSASTGCGTCEPQVQKIIDYRLRR